MFSGLAMAGSGHPKVKITQEAFSPAEVADILGVHVMTVRRWIRRRFLKAYRVGPLLVRIPRSEVARFRKIRLHFEETGDQPTYPEV